MALILSFGGQKINLKDDADVSDLQNKIALAISPNGRPWLHVDGAEAVYYLHVPSGGPIWIRDGAS